MQHSRLPTVFVLAALSLGALGYYEYSSDMAAWNQVQQSLTRLTSGIQFEPIITLRSKIADTDAAIKTYQSAFHVFPKGHEARLALGMRGIQYLAIAIDNAKDIDSWNDMSKYPDVTKFVRRTCDGAHLEEFSKETIKDAFALAGSFLVKEAAGQASEGEVQAGTRGFYPVLDFVKETRECKENHYEAVKIIPDKKNQKAHATQADNSNKMPNPDDVKPPETPSRIAVSGNVQAGALIRKVEPVYPPIAKMAHISGTVVLHAIIAKDGSVEDLQYVSGAPLLMKSAMDAVRQWRYQPTLVNGEPVEVETTISVVFALGA